MEGAPPPPGREPMLTFTDGAWRGEDETIYVFAITEQAMQGEAQRYLATQQITDPTSDQQSQAFRAVHTVAYWHDHDNPRQGDVHVIPKVARSTIDERITGWRRS